MDCLAKLDVARRQHLNACRLLEEALPLIRTALRAYPGNRFFRTVFRHNRLTLAGARLGLGEHVPAAAAAEEVLRADCQPAEDACLAAGVLARCGPAAEKDSRLPEAKRKQLADDYGSRAVAALRRAREQGFRDVAELKKDRNLDPIRKREDFGKLVRELESARPAPR